MIDLKSTYNRTAIQYFDTNGLSDVELLKYYQHSWIGKLSRCMPIFLPNQELSYTGVDLLLCSIFKANLFNKR
jgi:hypothetical protein